MTMARMESRHGHCHKRMEKAENLKIDPTFYDRADAHIYLSNSQLSDINPGKVSGSNPLLAALPLYLR